MFLNQACRVSTIVWRTFHSCSKQNVRFSSVDELQSPQIYADNLSKLTLPSGFRVIYCHTEKDCVHICNKLLSHFSPPIVVGCDAEWVPFRNNVAVLQLCFSMEECYIFHLSHIGHMPGLLQKIIFHRWVVKVGVAIKNDMFRLSQTYCNGIKVNPSSYIDLGRYADELGYRRHDNGKIKSCWSLKNLVNIFLNSELEKKKSLQLSNWGQYPLTEDQLFYAAMDAYSSLLLFTCLDNIRTKKDAPISSYPYLAKKLQLT